MAEIAGNILNPAANNEIRSVDIIAELVGVFPLTTSDSDSALTLSFHLLMKNQKPLTLAR